MDIDEEEQDYIKDVLYKHFVKDIKRHVTHGLPEWYKIKLAEGGLWKRRLIANDRTKD